MDKTKPSKVNYRSKIVEKTSPCYDNAGLYKL